MDEHSASVNEPRSLQNDKPRCACGVCAVYGHERAADLTYLGLHSLQHRGEESVGIAAGDGRRLHWHRGLGQVQEVFAKREDLNRLAGRLAVGHNRYPTTGSNLPENVQPIVAKLKNGRVALGHNGNLLGTRRLRQQLQAGGAIFQTSMDSELIMHLIARSSATTLAEQVREALGQIRGAYTLVIADATQVIGIRDPMGFRPLVLGRLGDGWMLASESCALDIVGAEYERDVRPGEMVILGPEGVRSERVGRSGRKAFCVFEYIYFMRPDSRLRGDYVDKSRRQLGKRLADGHPAPGDVVISVPDSSNTHGLGYAAAAGKRFEIGLIRNHYVGRTFIRPEQKQRDDSVRLKYNPVGGVLNGKDVVMVDDSIVRGTTQSKLVAMLRKAGARSVHVRIASPPIKDPCYYGMDFPTRGELIAANRSVEDIRREIGADSLEYLSLEEMLEAMPGNPASYCTACFSGRYPLLPDQDGEGDKRRLELVEVEPESTGEALATASATSGAGDGSQ
jgi:amidophosphoribosyltransferase